MRSKTMNMSEGRPLKLLTQQPFGSLGMALTTYAGQNYGARRTDRVREGLRDAMLAMAVFSGAMLVVIQLLGPDIVRAFVSAFRSDRKLIIDMHYEIDALFVSEFICHIASVLIIFSAYYSKRVIVITRTAKAVITAIVLKFSPVIDIVFRMICLDDRL